MEKKLEQLARLSKSLGTLNRSMTKLENDYSTLLDRVLSEVAKDRKEGASERALWDKLDAGLAAAQGTWSENERDLARLAKGFTKRLAAAKAKDKKDAVAAKKAEAKAKVLAKKAAAKLKAEANGAQSPVVPAPEVVSTPVASA